MKRCVFILSLLYLNVSSALAFQINSVNFDIKGGKFDLAGPKGQILNYQIQNEVLEYAFILETPYFKLGGYDGWIDLEKSVGLKSFPHEELTGESFPKFALLSEESNTVGFLIGSAGASGGSMQNVYFINTMTGDVSKIVLADMEEVVWKTDGNRIAGYKTYQANFYFGSRATSWGAKPRVAGVALFDEAGNVTFDDMRLKDEAATEYAQIAFSEEEIEILQDNVMSSVDYRLLGEKLVDFVFYGSRIGKKKDVVDFLGKLNPIYLQEAEHFIEQQ